MSFAFDTLAYARKLRDAKVPPEQAEAMADALAAAGVATGHDNRFAKIETDIVAIKTDLAVIKAELTFHRWVFLAMIGMQVAILIKLFLK